VARRRARHGEAPPEHWTHALAGLPWITVVLVVTLAVGGIELLRPHSYAASATVAAPDVRSADAASMLMADPALVDRVEDEVELGQAYRGSVDLRVEHARDDLSVHVEATAPDPRLAALAADTAAVLLVQDRGGSTGGLTFAGAAQVPAEPVRQRSLLWVWVALVALAGAVWMEGAHRIWVRDHPAPPPAPEP
jgi:hypothetical protein